jgi:hypothetical protein
MPRAKIYVSPVDDEIDGNSVVKYARAARRASTMRNIGTEIIYNAANTWALTVLFSTDDLAPAVTAIEADTTCVDLFEGQADADAINIGALINRLGQITVSQVPAAMRNRINTRLTNLGVDTTPITGTWTLRQVLRYAIQSLNSNATEDNVGVRSG